MRSQGRSLSSQEMLPGSWLFAVLVWEAVGWRNCWMHRWKRWRRRRMRRKTDGPGHSSIPEAGVSQTQLLQGAVNQPHSSCLSNLFSRSVSPSGLFLSDVSFFSPSLLVAGRHLTESRGMLTRQLHTGAPLAPNFFAAFLFFSHFFATFKH